MQIEVRDSFEESLKAFRKLIAKDGIHKQVKNRLAFIKPCEKRREKQRLNARRLREAARRKDRALEGRGRTYEPIQVREFKRSHPGI